MTGTFLPQARLPDMNLWEPGRQVVEEEPGATCCMRTWELWRGGGQKATWWQPAPGSPAFPANFACTPIMANPMTIAVSGESAEQKPPSVSADYQHRGSCSSATRSTVGSGHFKHNPLHAAILWTLDNMLLQLFVVSNPNSYRYWHSCSSCCTSCWYSQYASNMPVDEL